MSDEQKMEFIGSAFCTQYHCEAGFYIEAPGSGNARPCAGRWVRHLIVRYGKGYTGQYLPFNTNREREFAVGIRDEWSKEQLLDLLLHPLSKSSDAPFPVWELPTRGYGRTMLKTSSDMRLQI